MAGKYPGFLMCVQTERGERWTEGETGQTETTRVRETFWTVAAPPWLEEDGLTSTEVTEIRSEARREIFQE